MARNYTTISTHKNTQKVLEHIKSTGQSFDGLLKEMAEEKTGKDFEILLKEAEKEAEK